jgi:hypothetical protein
MDSAIDNNILYPNTCCMRYDDFDRFTGVLLLQPTNSPATDYSADTHHRLKSKSGFSSFKAL